MTHRSSCCPPSTSPTGRPCGWSRARPAPRRRTATRSTAALAWQDAGAEWIHLVDLDAAFGRGNNRELLAEVVGRLDVAVELSGGIRDDASLEAALATGCGAGQHRHRGAGDARLGARGDRPPRRPDRGRPRRARHHARRRAAGPRTAATCSRCWPAWTPTAAPATSSPTSTGRHADRPEPRAAARGLRRARRAAVVASGGVSSLDDLRALAALEPATAGSRARSSARRSTPARSPCARRWRAVREPTADSSGSAPAGPYEDVDRLLPRSSRAGDLCHRPPAPPRSSTASWSGIGDAVRRRPVSRSRAGRRGARAGRLPRASTSSRRGCTSSTSRQRRRGRAGAPRRCSATSARPPR